MGMKKLLALALTACMSLSLVACGTTENNTNNSDSTEGATKTEASGTDAVLAAHPDQTYYMVTFLSGYSFWTECWRGFQDAANMLGVKAQYGGSTEYDVNSAVTSLEQIIALNPTGMAVTCMDADAYKDPLNNAISSGIPVVTFDSDSADSNRSTFIGTSNYDAGKSMLARSIFGLEKITSGNIYIDRLLAKIDSPSDAIALGLAYVTDERKEYGLFPNLDSLENVFSLKENKYNSFFRQNIAEHAEYQKYAERLNMPCHPNREAEKLSGGEQQKLLLMRWLMSSAKIFIFDEPTKSIDIPSKIDLYNLFNDLILKDASIIICSSNLEELMGICDRTIILNHGSIMGEISYGESTQFLKNI